MLGHLGLNVPDLAAAKGYYDQIMPLFGYQEFFTTDTECAYMPVEGRRGAYFFFYQATEHSAYARQRIGLQHLAFIVRTRSAVQAVHDKVLSLGSEVLHAPREFPEYSPPYYYATFWLDPHAFMLEAACHHDRD
jgi:catechol 2,3-dioxygenase-like lactoylglutathione lyase family enzyme